MLKNSLWAPYQGMRIRTFPTYRRHASLRICLFVDAARSCSLLPSISVLGTQGYQAIKVSKGVMTLASELSSKAPIRSLIARFNTKFWGLLFLPCRRSIRYQRARWLGTQRLRQGEKRTLDHLLIGKNFGVALNLHQILGRFWCKLSGFSMINKRMVR